MTNEEGRTIEVELEDGRRNAKIYAKQWRQKKINIAES